MSGRSPLLRAAAVAAPMLVLALGGGASARAQSVCDLVPTRADEKVQPVTDGCVIDFPPVPGGNPVPGGHLGYRITLSRYDDEAQACILYEETRTSEPRTEPRAQMVDLGASYPAGGFESSSPQYAREYMEGARRVVEIHPATFRIAFCQPPYLFKAWASYTPKDAPAVPAETVEDLRSRARAVAARTGGGAEDAIASSLLSLFSGEEIAERMVLYRLVRLGILEPGDAGYIAEKKSRDPKVQAAARRLLDKVGNRPLSLYTDAERRALEALGRAALLASVLDVDGKPAFPALAANLGVIEALALRSVDREDPARAHQALTAMERYADMLQNVDVAALEERHGVREPARSEAPS